MIKDTAAKNYMARKQIDEKAARYKPFLYLAAFIIT